MATTYGVGQAMSQQPLPPGWTYSYLNDGFVGPAGEFISKSDVVIHGSFSRACANMFGGSQQAPQFGDKRINPNTYQPEVYNGDDWVDAVNMGATGAMGSMTSAVNSHVTIDNKYFHDVFKTRDSLTIGNIQPAAEISVEGKLGRITINLDTGELKMPPNVGRDAAIRDFWLGFQENFQPTNKAKYEQQIKQLQQEVAQVKATAALMRKDDEKEAAKKVAEKIAKKYNGEKFIMVKPEDLVRFIEEG